MGSAVEPPHATENAEPSEDRLDGVAPADDVSPAVVGSETNPAPPYWSPAPGVSWTGLDVQFESEIVPV